MVSGSDLSCGCISWTNTCVSTANASFRFRPFEARSLWWERPGLLSLSDGERCRGICVVSRPSASWGRVRLYVGRESKYAQISIHPPVCTSTKHAALIGDEQEEAAMGTTARDPRHATIPPLRKNDPQVHASFLTVGVFVRRPPSQAARGHHFGVCRHVFAGAPGLAGGNHRRGRRKRCRRSPRPGQRQPGHRSRRGLHEPHSFQRAPGM